MNQNPVILILALLLAAATGFIVYLVATNPVKGYHVVYETDDFILFAKDTGNKASTTKKKMYFEGGEHVDYKTGNSMIQQYRQNRIKNREDSLKVTRFVSFDFDNVFAYMGYLLTTDSPDIPKDDLGFRVYFSEELTARQSELGSYFPQSMLFAPTRKGALYFNKNNDKEFDFFDQGSICPVNCPDDDGIILQK